MSEMRAWDAMIFSAAGDTGVELETRHYDVQAQTRRILREWRDSGAKHLLLLVADTETNRRVLREFADYFAELPIIRTETLLRLLGSGTSPGTGCALI